MSTTKMNEKIAKNIDLLIPISEALNKLIKYPGNSKYTEKYTQRKNSFLKEIKLIQPIIKKCKKEEMIDAQLSTLNDKAKYKAKKAAVKQIKEILQQVDVESHEVLFTEVIIPKQLNKKLKDYLSEELADLDLVYGRSGTCTAFMLRKILEKSLFLAFSSHKQLEMIEDKASPNRYVGLEKMISISFNNKINGKPILLRKTGERLSTIKFLGDSAAHNFLVNPQMEQITPEMGIIWTALGEIFSHIN